MQLKRWESPRREGRNDKGRGGSARKRQLKKQRQMLRQKLKQADKAPKGGREKIFPFFFGVVLSYQLRHPPGDVTSLVDFP
jgi:hypothetical protein